MSADTPEGGKPMTHRVTLIHGAPARTEEYDCYIVELIDRNRARVRLRSGGVICVGRSQVKPLPGTPDFDVIDELAKLKAAFTEAHRAAQAAAWEIYCASPVGAESIRASVIHERIRLATEVLP